MDDLLGHSEIAETREELHEDFMTRIPINEETASPELRREILNRWHAEDGIEYEGLRNFAIMHLLENPVDSVTALVAGIRIGVRLAHRYPERISAKSV